jgi:nicotinamide mononucleotide transporter
MPELAVAIAAQARALSPLEVCAVVLAILYLLLAIRENILCWLAAGISTAIYVYLFATARLYMESGLNVFYFGMAVYGWYSWSHGTGPAQELPVTRWPPRVHAAAIVVIAALSAASGYALDRWSDAAFPYLDSFTTWSAIWTTFLVARKVLENWWYWLVIDSVSVFIYWSRDLELTAALFVVYLLLIPFGLWQWTRSYREAAV